MIPAGHWTARARIKDYYATPHNWGLLVIVGHQAADGKVGVGRTCLVCLLSFSSFIPYLSPSSILIFISRGMVNNRAGFGPYTCSASERRFSARVGSYTAFTLARLSASQLCPLFHWAWPLALRNLDAKHGYGLAGLSIEPASPFLLGLVELVARAPILVFGIVGGLFADRWPRRRLMIIAEASLLLQATLLAVLTLTGAITIEWILVLALLLGIFSALEIPVRQSFVADLVPRQDIPSAIGLNSSLFNGARIVGPSLAGLIVGLVGEGVCFVINAVSFLIILA